MLGLLIGHIIGDYYFQNNWIATHKKDSIFVMMLHVFIVFVMMFVTANLLYEPGTYNLAILLITFVHLIVDIVSSGLWKKIPWFAAIDWSPTPLFSILADQIVHIGSIMFFALQASTIVVYRTWVLDLSNISNYLSQPTLLLLTIFTLLYLIKPSSYFVAKAIETVLDQVEPEEDMKKSVLVGYLERLIICITIISGTYLALTVVIGFKTWSQSNKLKENEHEFTKKYLVGTMTSLFISIVLALIMRQYLHVEGIVIPQISS